ncbi:hypothetical protein MPTK1_8g15420 [Marchantia polymorpha subsp. ruderalis]|uniref:Uncharacterized protein n=1 Tax=Marchantia polymorpha TaxID=3197 RepID=A0A2R6WL60_MARPO|nr:hypothetical protein MARPO_0079s0071 [Marchantia polymorpha]BBN19982.1 hypothetical protein Mp_8g15420 [Marchantia polymorpha subsp. ruderalis]|eukprot:PTQ34571.1 hypothetical protein MARPO_0079s0071 [Marchantia polymorpha]
MGGGYTRTFQNAQKSTGAPTQQRSLAKPQPTTRARSSYDPSFATVCCSAWIISATVLTESRNSNLSEGSELR